MPATDALLELYQGRTGETLHIGDWLAMDQGRIDAFALATGDQQWIHTDPVRAAAESPYKSAIAHGFLTLSLLPYLTRANSPGEFEKNYPGMGYRVNYGLNKVRFPAAVKPGDRIRAVTRLLDLKRVGDGLEFCYQLTVELEGSDKPACVAEQLVRLYPKKN